MAQHHIANALSNILPPQRCDEVKPVSSQPCNEGPCQGVEWIVSDWSGVSHVASYGFTDWPERIVFFYCAADQIDGC